MRVALLVLALCAVGCRDEANAPAREPKRAAEPAAPAKPPPKIDVHTHFSPRAAPRAVALLAEHGIGVAVNLSGGVAGRGLEEQLAAARALPGRVVVFASPDWRELAGGPGYGARLAARLEQAHRLGARGLKISKALGLFVRDRDGRLVAVDDPELDPLFDTAGELGMPVAIHTGDPVAFWQPPTPDNERHAELSVHPGWSFHGKDVPSWDELFSAFERRVARHPKTTFIGVHFGNAPEHPDKVRALLSRQPNLYIDTAARLPEIGRHDPAVMRDFFVDFQDLILLGTDLGVGVRPGDLMLGSTGARPPTAADVEHFFSATWRYFETADRDFAHPTPIQGDWTIDGVDLPEPVLRKIYRDNAARLLGLEPPQR